ncbi:MAG: FeoB-associated Cys-rich membrane protein [Mucilaginibacter polytrichastri]|nr:FeoB-associated Cys-rich membrane protein [Mucilaginibacter polytrichastri]
MIYQIIIIALLFIAALVYMGRKMWNSIGRNKGCGTNCKCGVDFSEMEKKMQQS